MAATGDFEPPHSTPCPNCGHCPTCGKSNWKPQPWPYGRWPWTNPIYQYYTQQIQWTSGSPNASGGATGGYQNFNSAN